MSVLPEDEQDIVRRVLRRMTGEHDVAALDMQGKMHAMHLKEKIDFDFEAYEICVTESMCIEAIMVDGAMEATDRGFNLNPGDIFTVNLTSSTGKL